MLAALTLVVVRSSPNITLHQECVSDESGFYDPNGNFVTTSLLLVGRSPVYTSPVRVHLKESLFIGAPKNNH